MQFLLVFLSVTFALSLGAKLPLGGTQNFDILHRIQKGKDAHKGQFPYIVSLAISKVDGIYGCGGSIIDHTWILTAAHCTHNAYGVKIFYGTTEKWKGEISHVVSSDNIIEHEHYNDVTLENDIALIRTPRVEYSELVKKVPLADRDNDYVEASVVASGWGKNEYGTEQQNLQFIDLQIHSKINCWNSIICVDPFVGSGDSGGPLVTRNDLKLVGVASFLDPGRRGGFSRVSSYLDWIRNRTGLQ